MKISLAWLRRYIDVPLNPEELAGQLTMQGLEAESIEYLGKKYDGFFVGEVLSVARHPNADRLSVCQVSVGTTTLQIVCGAPNVAAGQKVAVGLEGALVPHNQHDPSGAPFALARVKLRGVESFGMICSSYELDLGSESDGILVLDGAALSGQPLAAYLGLDDVVMEIGLTPNRSDAMSHIGIAREVSVGTKKKVRIPEVALKEGKRTSSEFLSLRVEEDTLCPRYSARVVLNVRVGPSPAWLQKFLTAVKVRPINNIVDITNFVMLECGHPLHAFDYDRLSGKRVVVRRAAEGEKFTTLDHVSRAMSGETLLICDGAGPIGIAGVMGGENSEITEATKNVVIEGAWFEPRSIRRTSRFLGLSTDASQRFERGADIDGTLWAVNRAAQLMQEIGSGEPLKGALDAYPRKMKRRHISLRSARVSKILGIDLGEREIAGYLAKLNIIEGSKSPAGKRKGIRTFQVPSYRNDLEREIDLIEEVARIHGYNKIETGKMTNLRLPDAPSRQDHLADIRDALIGFGYQEIVTNSMQEKKIALLASDEIVEIANPISTEMAALRTSMIPSMLRIVRNNIFQGTKNLRLFELGKTYFRRGEKGTNRTEYSEKRRLLLAVSGGRSEPAWDRPLKEADLYDVKGDVQSFFHKIFLDKFNFIPYSTTNALTEKGLLIEINGVESGYLGFIAKELLGKFEIEQEVIAVELDLDRLLIGLTSQRKFRPLSRFPSVLRDIALVVEQGVPAGDIESVIRSSGKPYLSQVRVFDIYSGDQLAEGMKSVAFALEFIAEDHTMTQDEINGIMKNILSSAATKFNARLRG